MGENRNGSSQESVPPTITLHMCFPLKNKCLQAKKISHVSDICIFLFTICGTHMTARLTLRERGCIYPMHEITIRLLACYLLSWSENISATRTTIFCLKPTGHVCQPMYAYTHMHITYVCVLNLK